MRIAHLADCHVKNADRHDEYRELFSNLYEKLREQEPDRIAVVGDIFDSKTVLSPESITIVYDFFYNLAKIAEVDIFIGNHDANLSNRNRLNSLYPIWHFLKDNRRIHYYEKSGIYPIGDDTFYGVFSLLGSKDQWPIHLNRKPGETYVGVYHGPVHGSLTYGAPIESTVTVDMFDEYDMVLLGDIHKRQFFDTYVIEREIDEQDYDSYAHELGFEPIEAK